MEIRHTRRHFQHLRWRFVAFFPQFCCFCHRKTDTGFDLCRYCQCQLPSIVAQSGQYDATSVCLRCGFTWPDAVKRDECAHCVNHQTGFGRIICPYRYHFPIDGMIQRLKYQHHLPSGRLLGSLLAHEVKQSLSVDQLPDFLLPVPLSQARHRSRGFNHAAEMARWCAQELSLKAIATGAKRRFDTQSLAGLSRAERGLRIRGAFWVQERLEGRTVAIVDDVLTTGATAGELATELLDNGVAGVQLWVLARTPVTASAGGL